MRGLLRHLSLVIEVKGERGYRFSHQERSRDQGELHVDSRLVLRSLFAFPKSAFLPDTPTKSPAPRRAMAALARARRVWRATCLLSALVFASVAVSPLHAQTAHFAGAVTTLGGGFYSPSGVAVDSSGNVYVADSSSVKGAVYEMPAGCASSSCVTTLGGGFFEPAQLAVDGNGNVYVVDLNGSVTEMPAGCSSSNCVTALGGGFVYPFGVAVDASGNVYVTDQQNGGAVKEMPPGCTSTNFTNNACAIGTLGGGFQSAQGVTVDASGNVYVTDQQNGGAVKEMPSRVRFPELRHECWAAASTIPGAWPWTPAATSMSPISTAAW